MILTLEVEVVVSAPSFNDVPAYAVWPKGRTNLELKRDFQKYAWETYEEYIPLNHIRIGDKRPAA